MILAELDLEEWLREQGLGQYIPSVLKHTRTGAQLASLSVHDLEEVGGTGAGLAEVSMSLLVFMCVEAADGQPVPPKETVPCHQGGCCVMTGASVKGEGYHVVGV